MRELRVYTRRFRSSSSKVGEDTSFDTLAMTRQLKAMGLETERAEAIVEAGGCADACNFGWFRILATLSRTVPGRRLGPVYDEPCLRVGTGIRRNVTSQRPSEPLTIAGGLNPRQGLPADSQWSECLDQ